MDSIIKATAICSGGGIYIYMGQLSDESYFIADDSFMEYVEFYNADPYENIDESLYESWQKIHRIGGYSGDKAREFLNNALSWIIKNKPEGNYLSEEVETRLSKL